MHIPSASTQTLEILPFSAALEGYEIHDGGFDRSTWVYIPDTYGEYRYILGTKGRRPLICVGLNPSTAAPGDLDNTLKSVSRIAAGNGFDSWIMFNGRIWRPLPGRSGRARHGRWSGPRGAPWWRHGGI